MAQTLSKTNIINGQTVQAWNVTQSVDAFTGTQAYDITVSGSFTFSGATTGSGYFANAVSSSRSISSSYSISSSVAISSSYAASSLSSSYASSSLSSSYATSASLAISSNQLLDQFYDNNTSVVAANFKFIAGKNAMASGAFTSSAFVVLQGKTLGTNAWITANYQTPPGPSDSIIVNSISSSGQILMSSTTPGITATVIFTGIYI